jgi:hypothetical protein
MRPIDKDKASVVSSANVAWMSVGMGKLLVESRTVSKENIDMLQF